MERNPHRLVDNELRSYLQHVKGIIDKNEFEDEEERQILLNNVFSELRHKELNIATHSGVTRTLEGFLPLFSPYKLRAFLFHLRQRYVRLSTDCAGSHIFEKVIGLFGKFLGDEDADADEELDDGEGEEAKEKIPSCVDTLLGVCDELAPELGALTTDNYSTHVVRTLLRVLAGLPPSEPKTEQEKDDAQSVAPKKVPKKLLEKAKEVIEAILLQLQDDKHQAQDIIFHRCACPTIQTILAVLKQLDPERMEALIAQMLMLDSKDSAATLKHVGKALRHPIASHFIEKALQLCSPETYVRIYSDFFRHNIVEYGKDASANYVVQQLIASARHHAQPKLIFEELMESPHNVKSLFNSGKASVMLKLVEAFTKFTDIPKKDKRALCTSIRDVFMVEGEQPAAVAEAESEAAGGKGAKKAAKKESEKESGRVFDLKGLLEVKSVVRDAPTKPAFGKKKKSGKRAVSPFSPIGCRLVQSLMLFPFDCVDFLLNSFLALDTEYLLTMGLDSAASRVVEAYLDESCAAPVKHKLKLIRTMHGVYGKLAVDRCGSHIVEKCYKAADVNVKAMIADELVVDEKKLDAEKYGKAVLIKCKIGAYKMKKEAWTEKAASIDKKRKMFEDILNDQDDDLLPSAKAVELASPDQEKPEKKKKKEIGGFVVDKYGSAALKEELRRAAKRQKEEGEEEEDDEDEDEEDEEAKKSKTKAGKRKQLDAVESQMMELLGYGGDDADSSSSKKRRRDDDGDGEETNKIKKSNQPTKKKKNQNKKPRREEKEASGDTSLGFIMDVISATRSNKRAETPKQKQQVKEAQEAKLNKKKKQNNDKTAEKQQLLAQQTNSTGGNKKEKKQKEEKDGWAGFFSDE